MYVTPPADVPVVDDSRPDLWFQTVNRIDWRLIQDSSVMTENVRSTCREIAAGADETTQLAGIQARYKTWNSAEITVDGARQILDATRTYLCGRPYYE